MFLSRAICTNNQICCWTAVWEQLYSDPYLLWMYTLVVLRDDCDATAGLSVGPGAGLATSSLLTYLLSNIHNVQDGLNTVLLTVSISILGFISLFLFTFGFLNSMKQVLFAASREHIWRWSSAQIYCNLSNVELHLIILGSRTQREDVLLTKRVEKKSRTAPRWFLRAFFIDTDKKHKCNLNNKSIWLPFNNTVPRFPWANLSLLPDKLFVYALGNTKHLYASLVFVPLVVAEWVTSFCWWWVVVNVSAPLVVPARCRLCISVLFFQLSLRLRRFHSSHLVWNVMVHFVI